MDSQKTENCPVTPAPAYTPPKGYPAGYNPQAPPVYKNTPMTLTPLERLQKEPALVDCPFCGKQTVTNINRPASALTYLYGVGICCLFWPATCLPCLFNWSAHLDHHCGSCKKQLTHKGSSGNMEVLEAAKAARANRLDRYKGVSETSSESHDMSTINQKPQ